LGIDLNTTKQNTNICNHCKSSNLITDNLKCYVVCEDCASIVRESVEEYLEYSNNENDTNSRYGQPSSFFFPKTSLGSKIVSSKYNKLCLIQKQGQMPYKEKNLMCSLEKIQNKCKKYNITQTIIDSAKILYKKVIESTHSKGKRKGKNIIMRCINRKSMISACLFFACKLQNEPRSPKEIADIYELEIKHINKGCKRFCDIIDINILLNHSKIKSSVSTDFIERFSKKLCIETKYIEHIKNVSNNINKLDLIFTHEPPSIAAGCILLVVVYFNLDITKKQISEIFGLSDVTISKTFRRLWAWHKIIINNKITDLVIERLNNIKCNNCDIDNLFAL
jgi:transcription initiation factor TFIIB